MLGESPYWHKQRKSCFWVDIENGTLFEFHWETRMVKQWKFNTRVSVILGNKDNDLVIGAQGGIMQFSFKDERIHWLTDIDSTTEDNRCNDGGCDCNGRIWIGTMDVHCREAAGSLFCVDEHLRLAKMMTGLTIPNGLVWSNDNKFLYFIESMSRTVKSYVFNKNTGEISDEKIIIRIPEAMGMPDGMAIDEEGMLWIAMYGGFCVKRWDPQTGELLHSIWLPVPNVTNCCFAGDDMSQLIVTTARENLSSEDLENYPGSGNVFIIDNPGVSGVAPHHAIYE